MSRLSKLFGLTEEESTPQEEEENSGDVIHALLKISRAIEGNTEVMQELLSHLTSSLVPQNSKENSKEKKLSTKPKDKKTKASPKSSPESRSETVARIVDEVRPKNHLTVKEVAERLGASRSAVRNHVDKGRLSGHLVDSPLSPQGILFIDQDSLDSLDRTFKQILTRSSTPEDTKINDGFWRFLESQRPEGFLTTTEAARKLGVSPSGVRDRIKRGTLEAHAVSAPVSAGKIYFISGESFELLRRQKDASQRLRNPKRDSKATPSVSKVNAPEGAYSVVEAAAYLGLTPEAVRLRIKRGVLPAERIGFSGKPGYQYFLKKEDLDNQPAPSRSGRPTSDQGAASRKKELQAREDKARGNDEKATQEATQEATEAQDLAKLLKTIGKGNQLLDEYESFVQRTSGGNSGDSPADNLKKS